MSKQVSPAAVAGIIAVVVVVIGIAVWKLASGGGYVAQVNTTANNAMMQKMKQGTMPGIMRPGGKIPGTQ